MNLLLVLAFLFSVGATTGWVLELFFRRFFSASNPGHKWVNPGFCTGPYLPLYGFGLCILYLLSYLEDFRFISEPVWNKICLFLVMAAAMTAIEYIAGLICVRFFKVRLWDYSGMRGNIQGIICPLFSMFWAILGAVYYFLIHPHILGALAWLSQNLAFSFVIGFFFGVFVIDVTHSMQLVSRFKRFAEDNHVIVRVEAVKARIREKREEAQLKVLFFRPFHSDIPLSVHLKELKEEFEEQFSGRKPG